MSTSSANTLLIFGHSFVKRLHQDVEAGKVWLQSSCLQILCWSSGTHSWKGSIKMSRRGRFNYNHHAFKYSVDRRAFIREKAQARCQGGEGLITIIMPTNTLLIVGHSFVKRLKQDVEAGKVRLQSSCLQILCWSTGTHSWKGSSKMSRRGRFDYNHHAYKYSVDRRALIREKAQARCQGGEGLITIIMPTNTLLIDGHSFVKRLKQDVKAGKVWLQSSCLQILCWSTGIHSWKGSIKMSRRGRCASMWLRATASATCTESAGWPFHSCRVKSVKLPDTLQYCDSGY